MRRAVRLPNGLPSLYPGQRDLSRRLQTRRGARPTNQFSPLWLVGCTPTHGERLSLTLAKTRPTCPGGAGSGRPAPQPRTRDWSYGRRLLPIYCPLRPGEEGTKFNGGAGPACRTRVRRPPPSALVEGRRAPSSTCSACNKLVGQLPQSWPFALGRAGFSHHEGAFYRSTDLPTDQGYHYSRAK